jgi:hypothetical protein
VKKCVGEKKKKEEEIFGINLKKLSNKHQTN